jgi:hypothetical protein
MLGARAHPFALACMAQGIALAVALELMTVPQ